MIRSILQKFSLLNLGLIAIISAAFAGALSQQLPARLIQVDLKRSTGPVDRLFDLSVGSDYPGTLIRDDSQAQLKLAADELGFR